MYTHTCAEHSPQRQEQKNQRFLRTNSIKHEDSGVVLHHHTTRGSLYGIAGAGPQWSNWFINTQQRQDVADSNRHRYDHIPAWFDSCQLKRDDASYTENSTRVDRARGWSLSNCPQPSVKHVRGERWVDFLGLEVVRRKGRGSTYYKMCAYSPLIRPLCFGHLCL